MGILASLLLLVAAASPDPTPFDAGLTPARILHVDPRAPARGADGSESRPYPTLADAARHAKPGDALRLAPGEHRGGITLSDLAGTADAPIWIGGDPDSAVPATIIGGGSGLHLVRARYLVVHDLDVTGASGNGVNADDAGERTRDDASHHLVFRNLVIHDIGGDGNQDGLKLSGVRDFWVIACDIRRCGGDGSGSGIDMVGCHRGLIDACTLADLSGNAIQAKGGTADVDILGCRVSNPGHRGVNIGGSTGFEFFRPPLAGDEPSAEARRVRVRRCVFEGGMAPIAFVGAVECEASHNTIVRPEKWVLRILQETRGTPGLPFAPCGRNRFSDNLVWFERARVARHVEVNIGPGTDAASFVFSGNLWFAADDPSASGVTLPVPETDALVGIDPMLADPARGEYGLLPGSPAPGAFEPPE